MRDSCEKTVLTAADSAALELELQRFERAWQMGSPPAIADFLNELTLGGESFTGLRRFQLVTELVAIDLEKRWRAAANRSSAAAAPLAPHEGQSRPVLEDYLRQLPELTSLDALPIALIGHEYRVRHLWGDRPPAAEYRLRFAAQGAAVENELAAIDDELPDLRASTPWAQSPHDPRVVQTFPYAMPDQDRSPLSASYPTQIGRFLIRGQLGTGSYGVVYDAHDPELDRDVALKVPHPERVAELGGPQPFLEEARTIANLDHAGIVPVYEAGTTSEGLCYLVTKRLTGGDLEQLLAKRRPSQRESVEMVARLAEAVQHAHQRRLIHRDIKPANILLDDQGQAMLADFGMALREKHFGDGPRLAGTLKYMSPEQAAGKSHLVDARSDVFSLGLVLFELLCGRSPYRATQTEQLTAEITTCQPRPLRQLDDSVSEELDRICQKARALLPNDRYATAADLAADLRRFLQPPPDPRPNVPRAWHLAAALGAAVAVLGIGWSAWPRGEQAPPPIAPFLNLYLQPRGAEEALPHSLQSHDLPLRAHDRLMIDVGLRHSAYLYVLQFSEGEPPKILWPTDLNDQRPVQEISENGPWLAVELNGPPRKVMLVAATSSRELHEADLAPIRRVAFSLAGELSGNQPLKEFLYPPDPDRARVRGGNAPTVQLDVNRLSRHPERELQRHFQAFAAQAFYYGSME